MAAIGQSNNNFTTISLSRYVTAVASGKLYDYKLMNKIVDADGKTVSIVGTDGTTYVEGDSDYTITVGSYQDSADTSASTTVDDWSNYEIERPESL